MVEQDWLPKRPGSAVAYSSDRCFFSSQFTTDSIPEMAKFSLIPPLCLLAALLCGCGKQDGGSASSGPAEVAVTAKAPANSEFEKLKGRWMRADGDYVLEISQIDESGKMAAKYFNPGPINVSKALALREGAATRVFVELRDTGYPGCTYSLSYDGATDQLFGQYYQAAMQETYDVVFARLKQE